MLKKRKNITAQVNKNHKGLDVLKSVVESAGRGSVEQQRRMGEIAVSADASDNDELTNVVSIGSPLMKETIDKHQKPDTAVQASHAVKIIPTSTGDEQVSVEVRQVNK